MKNETKTFSEYKAPKCKMVEVQVQKMLCQSNLFDSVNKTENFITDDEEEL